MKNILIVVDVQEGFIRNNQTIKAAKKIEQILEKDIFDVVLATQFENERDSLFVRGLGWEELFSDEQRKIYPPIINKIDKVFKKSKYSVVDKNFLKELEGINDNKKPNFVFIVGIDTDSCVAKIAVDLFENNIMPIVLLDYTASNGGDESHNAGKTVLRRFIGRKALIESEISTKEELEDIKNTFDKI